MESADLFPSGSAEAGISENLMEELEAEEGEADDPLPPLPDLVIANLRSPTTSRLGGSSRQEPPAQQLSPTEEEKRVRNRYRKMALYSSMQNSSSDEDDDLCSKTAATEKVSSLNEKENSASVNPSSKTTEKRVEENVSARHSLQEEDNVSPNREQDNFSDMEGEGSNFGRKISRSSGLQLSSDEDDNGIVSRQKPRKSTVLQSSSDEEGDVVMKAPSASSSSSDEGDTVLNTSRRRTIRPASSSSSSSSSDSSEDEGTTSKAPAPDNDLFDTEADLPVEASPATGRSFLLGNSGSSSDSTSSDDEPPPLSGRWTHSGGAAKKQSANRSRQRPASDEEVAPEPRNERKAKENLLAIHSESQRLIREADVRLPYHEPKRFSKFSEFKAMLEAERNSEGAKASASKPKSGQRPARPARPPRPDGAPLPPDATSTQIPLPPDVTSAEVLLPPYGTSAEGPPPDVSSTGRPRSPDMSFTENPVDMFAPHVPHAPDVASPGMSPPLELPDIGPLEEAPLPPGMEFAALPKGQEDEEARKDPEIASESDLFSSKPSSPGPGMFSTPCGKLATVDPLRSLPLVASRIDFDADSVDLDAGSVAEEPAAAPAPLASRLAAGQGLPADLLASLRGVSLAPRLARPDPDGFVDLRPPGAAPDLDVSTDSTRSLHPMLRRLRRHQKPAERRASAVVNKSVQIVTKVKEGEDERLRLEEVRLMPPPPVPPVGATASARAANWRAHRQLLQEQMRQKRLQGLAERQRQWALYNNEDGAASGGTKQKSADDMDSDDEEYAPEESGDSEEDSEAEEGDDEEEEDEEDEEEEEEEEERTSVRKQRQSFLDAEAEEADGGEDEETFEDAVGGGQDDLTLHLVEDDDEAMLGAPVEEVEEEDDVRTAISSRRSDSRKLSLNSRDLFASDADEISSVRSSASSVFQPGQRSFVIPDDSHFFGGSSRQTSDCEGRSSLDAPMDDNSSERSKHLQQLHDDFMEDEPRQLSSQDALRLFSGGITATSDAIDAAAADLFLTQTQTAPSSQPPPPPPLSQGFSSSEDEEVFLRKRPTQRLVSSDDEASEKGDEVEEGEESAEEDEELGGADEEAEFINDREEEEEVDEAEEDEEPLEEDEEDEEDDERAVFQRLEQQQKKSKPRANVADFLEQEAELSGSGEDVSSDENEDGLGGDLEDTDWIEKNPRAAGDAVQLQRDLERVHARLERDEDQRAVRYLQELYLPDGDLTAGESAARRRFRWRGVEEDGEEGEGDAPQLESDESDGEQASFVEDRRPVGVEEKLDTSVASTDGAVAAAKEGEEESQLFRIGLTALQKVAPRVDAQPDSAPPLPTKSYALVKRGSFLSKASSDLGRIGDLMRQTDQAAPRKSGMVCFSREDVLQSKFLKPMAQPAKPAKRPSNDGDSAANKRSRTSGPPLRPINSIFCSMEK